MPLPKEELEKYKQLLLEEQKNILEMFADSEQDFNELTSSSGGDIADVAYNWYEKGRLIGLSDREREVLQKIDEALKRIEDGTYGYCEVTGKPIESDRLEAIPYTPLCAEEAMKRAKHRFTEM